MMSQVLRLLTFQNVEVTVRNVKRDLIRNYLRIFRFCNIDWPAKFAKLSHL